MARQGRSLELLCARAPPPLPRTVSVSTSMLMLLNRSKSSHVKRRSVPCRDEIDLISTKAPETKGWRVGIDFDGLTMVASAGSWMWMDRDRRLMVSAVCVMGWIDRYVGGGMHGQPIRATNTSSPRSLEPLEPFSELLWRRAHARIRPRLRSRTIDAAAAISSEKLGRSVGGTTLWWHIVADERLEVFGTTWREEQRRESERRDDDEDRHCMSIHIYCARGFPTPPLADPALRPRGKQASGFGLLPGRVEGRKRKARQVESKGGKEKTGPRSVWRKPTV